MPLENGGRQKMLSGESPHLQEDGPRYSGQFDNTDTQPVQTSGQNQNPGLFLEAGREDINLNQQNEQQQGQVYDSEYQRDVYQSREKSFNGQRQNYTEKPFNSYKYEMLVEQVTVTKERKHTGSTNTGGGMTGPPPIPSANPDSELELSAWAQQRMDLNGKRISLLDQDRTGNVREREKLMKKQPSIKIYSIKEGGNTEKCKPSRKNDIFIT